MDDGTGTPIRPPGTIVTATSTPTLTASPGALSPTMAATAATPVARAGGGDTSIARPARQNGICVFSGGTAANSLVDAFQAVAAHLTHRGDSQAASEQGRKKNKTRQPCSLTYIIPISDNGGSSSELIRFFGGPSVGDIRSRLVRLIPTGDDDEGGGGGGGETGSTVLADANAASPSSSTTVNERAALRALFEHRLCASDPSQARTEWLDLVEARHLLWTFVPSATRELIRAVLNTLNLEIVKRARPSTSVFNFAGASVGNLFLTGARLFSGSFEAAIYLLSLLCGIPDHVAVLPAINSNFTHHISAGLADGTAIAGQVNISHPSAPTSLPDGAAPLQPPPPPPPPPLAGPVSAMRMRQRASTAVDFEDATLPGSLPVLRRPQIAFSKEDEEELAARIARVWYINPYGHEIRPPANPKALAALRQAEAIIYSIGSLYTSIVPSLVLRGVGAAISEEAEEGREGDGDNEDDEDDEDEGGAKEKSTARKKILILNSKLDRETGPRRDAMTAADFVRAIVAACKQSQSDFAPVQDGECQRYVTHLVYLDRPAADGNGAAAPAAEAAASAPAVDTAELRRLGVVCVAVPSQASAQARLHGDRRGNRTAAASKRAAERYDQQALTHALERLLDGTWNEAPAP